MNDTAIGDSASWLDGRAGGFGPELRDLGDQLQLPRPERARLLLELNADLAAMTDSLLRRGVSPEAARRQALDTLLPTPDVLDQLYTLHRPLYARLVDRFSDPTRHRLERTLFGFVLASFAVLGSATLSRLDFLNDPAPFTVPVLGLGLAGLALVIWKLFHLYLERIPDVARADRGLGWLPAIAAAAAVTVLLGLAVDLRSTAGLLVEASAEDRRSLFLAWLRRDSAMASLGLVVAAFSTGAWLWLSSVVARLRGAELDIALNLQGGEAP